MPADPGEQCQSPQSGHTLKTQEKVRNSHFNIKVVLCLISLVGESHRTDWILTFTEIQFKIIDHFQYKNKTFN